MRGAAAAGIHASMVIRYFESKEGPFAAAAEFDLRLPDFSTVPRDALGQAMVRHFLERWEGADSGDELRALLGVAHTNNTARERLAEIFRDQVSPMVVRAARGPDKERCAALIVRQMLGVAFTRYILRLPAIVHLSPAVIERRIGAVIQSYLDDADADA